MEASPHHKSLPRLGILRFFRNLVLTGLVGLAIIVGASGYGIYLVYQGHVVNEAEEDALQVTKVMIAEHRDLLFTTGAGGERVLFVDPMYRDRLDRRLYTFLTSFNIVKVKVYDDRGRILHSSEADLIGRVDSDNPRLLRALLGQVDSHIEHKDSIRDLDRERKLDVDVVETYVPIQVAGETVGAFEVYLDVTRYRQEIHAGVATSILILGGILLMVFGVSFLFVRRSARRLERAQEQLREMATVDALTGVLNRGTILARAREEVSRAERLRQDNPDYGLAFVLLDVDHFKRVNDTFGHLTGDQVLREMAERVRETLRDYDLLGRYGGEEFLVVLPDSTLEGALAAAERIRRAVRGRPFVFAEPLLELSVSLGVARVLPGEADLSRILQRADEALYLAKERGRDRVEAAGAESDGPPAAAR